MGKVEEGKAAFEITRETFVSGDTWIKNLEMMGVWPGFGNDRVGPYSLATWFKKISDQQLQTLGSKRGYIDSSGMPVKVDQEKILSGVENRRMNPHLAVGLDEITGMLRDPTYESAVPSGIADAPRQLKQLERNVQLVAEEQGVSPEEQEKRFMVILQDREERAGVVGEAFLQRPKRSITLTELRHVESNSAKALMRKMGITNREELEKYVRGKCGGDTLSEMVVREVAKETGMPTHRKLDKPEKAVKTLARYVTRTMLMNSRVLQATEKDRILAEKVTPTKAARINNPKVLVPGGLGETEKVLVGELIGRSAFQLLENINEYGTGADIGTKLRTGMLAGWNSLKNAGKEYSGFDVRSLKDGPAKLNYAGAAAIMSIAGLLVGQEIVAAQGGETKHVWQMPVDLLANIRDEIADRQEMFGQTTIYDDAMLTRNVSGDRTLRVGNELGVQWSSVNEYLRRLPSETALTLSKLSESFDENDIEKWKFQATTELTRLGGEFAQNPGQAVEISLGILPLGALRGDKKKRLILLSLLVGGAFIGWGCGGQEGAPISIPTAIPTLGSELPSGNPIENPTADPRLDVIPTSEAGVLQPAQNLQGEAVMQYLAYGLEETIYGRLDSTRTQYTFTDASGKEVTVSMQNVSYDAGGKVVGIFDDERQPQYIWNNGGWFGVTEEDQATHFIREINLEGRSVNWHNEKWELSLPITNEELKLLGPYYTLENDTLIYDGPTGKFEINDGVLKFVGPHVKFNAIELGVGRDIKIKTAEGGELLFPPESLRVNLVKAVDWDGTPIDSVVTMEAPGWGPLNQFILTPEWGEWTTSMDVASTRHANPEPTGNNLTPEIVSAWAETEFAAMSEITWDDIFSRRLFWNEVKAMRPLPANYRVPTFHYINANAATNTFVLTQYPDMSLEMNIFGNALLQGDNPIRFENDPVQLLAAYKFLDPFGEWKVRESRQYPYGDDGRQLIIPVYFGKDFINADSIDPTRIQVTIAEPSKMIVQPIVSTKRIEDGQDCAPGSQGDLVSHLDTCKLYDDYLPAPREFLPGPLQELIAQYDNGEALATTDVTYPVGAEFPSLQAAFFIPDSFQKHWPQYSLPYMVPNQ